MFKKLTIALCLMHIPLHINGNKCESIPNVTVCNTLNVGNNATVAGNSMVRGTLSAGSFLTRSGAPFTGSSGSDLAYASSSLVNAYGTTIANGGLVPFTALAEKGGFTLATSSITVPSTGVYKVQFQVRGIDDIDVGEYPLYIQVVQNGTTNLGIFISNDLSATSVGNPVYTSVNGTVVVSLSAGDTLSLMNVDGSFGSIVLGESSDPVGIVDAFIVIEQIA